MALKKKKKKDFWIFGPWSKNLLKRRKTKILANYEECKKTSCIQLTVEKKLEE